MHRRAFTMVELMVVILVIITLMGISMGAWSGLLPANARTATRGLLSDQLRQARSRSLSSNRPVHVILDRETATIRGIDERLIWSEDFEWYTGEADLTTRAAQIALRFDVDHEHADAPLAELDFGANGYGWDFGWNTDSAPLVALPLDPHIHPPVILRAEDGFMLELSLRIPLTSTVDVMPVALITEAGISDEVDQLGVIGGLELWRQDLIQELPDMEQQEEPDTSGSRLAWHKNGVEHWALVAWIGQRPEDPTQYRQRQSWSTDRAEREWWDELAGTDQDEATFSLQTDQLVVVDAIHSQRVQERTADVLQRGDWVRVGMQFSGLDPDRNTSDPQTAPCLRLLRDGRVIAERHNAELAFDPSFYGPDDGHSDEQLPTGGYLRGHWQVHLGRHTLADSRGTTKQIANLMIDEVQLLRQGTGEPVPLPSGIRPQEDVHLVVADGVVTGTTSFILSDEGGVRDIPVLIHPEGRVELTDEGSVQ
ncbi:MAG: pilus assembly FimT family protein [Planctomycetota bacterium]